MEEIFVFTDGGAFDKGEGKFRAVTNYRVFNSKKELLHKEIQIIEEGTSPFAEIKAIANGLTNVVDYLEETKKKNIYLKLYTDSMLCRNSLTQWIYSWIKKQRNGIFYGSTGQPVANQDTIKEAFAQMLKIKKVGNMSIYHINSHVAKKNVKQLKKDFEKFNKIKVTDEEFLFIYLQNRKCDEEIKEAHAKFIENQTVKNKSLEERLKEGI